MLPPSRRLGDALATSQRLAAIGRSIQLEVKPIVLEVSWPIASPGGRESAAEATATDPEETEP
jgi:hypothetical protein